MDGCPSNRRTITEAIKEEKYTLPAKDYVYVLSFSNINISIKEKCFFSICKMVLLIIRNSRN